MFDDFDDFDCFETCVNIGLYNSQINFCNLNDNVQKEGKRCEGGR